jgi:hypothetical protein
MKDRLEFSKSGVNLDNKQQQREEIARHTEEYLARGGEITYLPYDPTAEIMARVGQWQALGEAVHIPEDDDTEYVTYTLST